MLSLLAALAWASDPPSAAGFLRLWADPASLELHPSAIEGVEGVGKLALANPFARRADVRVEGVLVGQLAPRATGTLSGVPLGSWQVAFTMPDGDGRVVTVVSTPP